MAIVKLKMDMTLRCLLTFSLMLFLGASLDAQVEILPLQQNPILAPDSPLKVVEHPNCQNRPFLFIYVDEISRPSCGETDGSITVSVLSSEGSVALTMNDGSPVNVTGSSYTFDNLGSGVYYFESSAQVEPEVVLNSNFRALLNNDGINNEAYAGIFEFTPAFCGLGMVRKADAVAIGASPIWDIYSRDGVPQGTLNITTTELPLEPGEYFAELLDFVGCPILVDFTMPEIIHFELTDDNIFFDDFSDSSVFPDDKYWADDQAFINETFAFNPPSIGVATLDGLDENGEPYIPSTSLEIGTADNLTSVPFCMAGIQESDNLFLSFYYQQQGLGDYPNSGDSLVLELKDVRIDDDGVSHPGKWNEVWSQTGINQNLTDSSFLFVNQEIADEFIVEQAIQDTIETLQFDTLPGSNPLIIDTIVIATEYDTLGMATFFLPGFQFRFRSIATATGNNDHWNIDYVQLTKDGSSSSNPINDVSHIGPSQSFLQNYTSMPWNQFVNHQDTELNTELIFPVSNNGPNTQIENTFVTITELCSETVIDDINAAIFLIDGATTGEDSQGNAINIPAQDTIADDNTGGDDLLRSTIPNSFDATNGIVIRTEAVLDVSDDIIATNDTLIHDQIFSNFFAYDDGSAEKVFKLQVAGTQFAYRFVLNEPDAVKGIGFAFNQIKQEVDPGSGMLRLMVWEDIKRSNADGTVGEELLLYDDSEVAFPFVGQEQNDYHHYYFGEDVFVQDTFYVGFELVNPGAISFGYDRNNNNIDKWFTRDGGFWESLVESPTFPTGSPMIRALVGDGIPLSIEDEPLPSFGLYPNPAKHMLSVVLR